MYLPLQVLKKLVFSDIATEHGFKIAINTWTMSSLPVM